MQGYHLEGLVQAANGALRGGKHQPAHIVCLSLLSVLLLFARAGFTSESDESEFESAGEVVETSQSGASETGESDDSSPQSTAGFTLAAGGSVAIQSSPGERPSTPGKFMNIDDLRIPGEATSDSHRDWIELTSVMDGMHREGLDASGSNRRRSSVVFDGFHVGKLLDRSSPKLREAIADGTIFTEVEIDIVASCGGNAYTAFAITLSTARIEQLESKGGRKEKSSENISFNYSRMETIYTPVNDDCSLDAPVFSTQDGELLEL